MLRCKLGFHKYQVHSFTSFKPDYVVCFLKCSRCDKKTTKIALGAKHPLTPEVYEAKINWDDYGKLPK